jgi:hypothetical protein
MTITHWRIEFPPSTKNHRRTNVKTELQILAMMFFHRKLSKIKTLRVQEENSSVTSDGGGKQKEKKITMKRQSPGFNRTLSLLQ